MRLTEVWPGYQRPLNGAVPFSSQKCQQLQDKIPSLIRSSKDWPRPPLDDFCAVCFLLSVCGERRMSELVSEWRSVKR